MDQRVKGGTPPTTTSTLDTASASEEAKQDQAAEKRRRSEDVRKKEEEKRGCKKDGNKAAVLELLIEGRCGGVGQQELQISGRETSCPEGNVRVRIGLQAKRTKKPPKILESYVCKPTIRTYQRQGRGGPPRADGEGKAVQQSKGSSTTDEANREQRVGLDATQTTSKKTACAASQPLTSSSSSTQPLSVSSTKSSPASAPATTSQGSKPDKQVPIKLADKTEEKVNGSSEREKKDKLSSVNGQPVPAGPKLCSPATDQTASTARSAAGNSKVSTLDTRNDGSSSKKHNGLVQMAKQKGLSDGRSSANILGPSSKSKAGKHVSASSVSSTDSPARPLALSGPHKELLSKSRPDSPSRRPDSPKPQSSPAVDLSSTSSKDQDPSLPERRREKERKAKKEKRRAKKLKQDKLEAEREKTERLKDEVKKKKKDKDGKSRRDKEKAQKQRDDDSWELKTEGGKVEKREKLSSDGQGKVDNNIKCSEMACKQDKTCKTVTEKEKTDDSCRAAKQAEPTTTGDSSKSKDQDVSRHSAAPPAHSASSAPPPPANTPVSPTASPPEQDSRPLKKRKARRPSWTKLVHRAHRLDSQDVSSDSPHNPSQSFPLLTKASFPAKTTVQPSDESHLPPSSCSSSLSSTIKPPTPKQTHPATDPVPLASVFPTNSVRKRGRPKSHSFSSEEPPPQLSPNAGAAEELPAGCHRVQKAPVLKPILQPSPKKRGRPPKRAHPEFDRQDAPDLDERGNGFHPPEKGNRQLKIRRLINEMKKRKKRRFHKAIMSGYVRKEGRAGEAVDGRTSLRMATTVHTLSALSSSFGSKLGPQINVSKRGTIYMGKRRGRKPKAHAGSQCSTQATLFTGHSEGSLFSSSQLSHPFPSPSLTHSSGAQSPYSEGSLTEPSSSLLFSHHFSLPSPTSSCTSPRPPSSPFVKKSCPCQGRHQFPFHQSTCKLSCATPPLHPTPGSPSHLKEATPSPRSESHSDETLPSDSGIGTDNNSVSERGEMRGARGGLRFGPGSGVTLGAQRLPPSPVSPPSMSRHSNAIGNLNSAERHRHRRRDHDCPSSCACLCSCPGHKCTLPDYVPCLGHGALKRQKNKHKKKHQQLQDPEFLAELDDLIAQFGDVHIGRRSWARMGPRPDFDKSAAGGRRHNPPSSHPLRSNVFRINLNGFYSPHPSSFSGGPSFTPQPFYPCHCNRKLDRRQCGCPSKFQETIDNMGYYSSYPPAPPGLYHHLPSSYPLPPPHQYALHQPHHAHFLLNPARFHRRRSRLLREGALGGEVEGGSKGGGGLGFTSSLSCAWGRSEHKHKHRHRHFEQNLDDEEEEDGMEREALAPSKTRARFVLGQAEEGRKGLRGPGSTPSKEWPWLRQGGAHLFSSAASSSTSSSSSERYKNTSLTSLGLGSSHLSSFGGGWGGLGQSWTKFGSLGSPGFGKSSWTGFTEERHARRPIASDGEDEDGEDVDEPSYRTSISPTHTNLFTSAALVAGGRGLRSGLVSGNPGSGERSWRREEPSWTERRDTALQGDPRSWGQQGSVPAQATGKRGPGRPRKHPLPPAASSSSSSATFSSSASPPDLLPANRHSRDGREAGGGGGGQQVTELEARRKRGRKRKHGDSPCHVSFDKECHALPEFLGQSDGDVTPPRPAAVRSEDRTEGPPRKTFLSAGLYSDDYKTTEPPSQARKSCSENLEYTPGEHEYSLLPAPIHVGKYLRLKRLHFQLPYDVMWLWQHNQLYRKPAVPLKRKRRYCRLKQRTSSSSPTGESSSDIASLFPHLNVEPLTSSERSFVVKHHVFLVRNLELVRDRQLRMRMERERDEEEEEEEEEREEREDGTSGDDSHFKSDHSVGVEVTVISSEPHHQSQDTCSVHTASPNPTKTQNRQEEEEDEEEEEEEEIKWELCSREQRRKRLNDLLLQKERWSHSAAGTRSAGGQMDSN
ncbi:histone-lysine N-methyltransferase ASH1L [Austrofundulus limnaeus]|uniref:Histone-lysine N-methyltransferase ASH1L n=1 Tax=Austrofundulus limnaeus TaxID=52670 RepID=A0A2I4CSG6_AUSLI|nr:PREDICTED: histone-lysine N-methyltransferase ASH1L [Austrofundulus limnaeus]